MSVPGLACNGDGIGIGDGEVTVGDDTISGNEQLTVTFSSPVVFNSFGFLDMYASGGDDTTIVIWTTRQMTSVQNMTLHDGDGTSKPITTPFLADNLNLIDLEADPEVTSGFFRDGYVRWTIPNGGDSLPVDVLLFSMVSSPTFGAIQTLLPNFYD